MITNRMVLKLLILGLSVCTGDAIAASAGRTIGRFQVSPTGSAQYSIPIWAPKGPHGVQPHIALSYNSAQGNGYVGVGWMVSGLSSIYRCNLTIAQDGVAAPVALKSSDGYCMDGQRLLSVGSSYQTEIANFVSVQAYGSAGGQGPAYWVATDRNGWVYTYGGGGASSNAQVLASGSSVAESWQLNEVQDTYGNTMTISYSTSNVTGTVVPHVISWVPASSGSSSYNFTMTFNYGITSGSVYGYVGGTPFNNTNILSSIAIAYQGTAMKTYYLTYSNTGTATSRYLLTQVQECAGTGTGNCLSPTTVGWQAGAAGVASGTALGGTVGYVVSTAYDLDGDGINDLVMNSGGNVVVARGSSSGYGTPVATGLSSSGNIGDIDGTGVAGFLVNVSGTWYYYKWNGSRYAGTTTGITAATAPSPVLADLDGDGRADIAYTDSSGYVHVRLSTSTAGTVSFASDINTLIGGSGFSISAQSGGSNRGLHFWGSAQSDLLGTTKTCSQTFKGTCIAWNYIYNTLHFTGSSFATAGLSGTLSSPNPAVDFADYNDDGCTDVLTATQLLLSACDGTAPVPVNLPTGVTAIGGMDWNGDGRRDVVVAQSSGYVGVVLSTGSGLSSTVISTTLSTSGLYYSTAPNLTGDGQDGLIAYTGTSATVYQHNSPAAPPDLLTSVADGYGNSASPTYKPLPQAGAYYVQYNTATYPSQHYNGPLYVATNVVFSDPSTTSGTYNQTIWYYEAWVDLLGRGFEGFQGYATQDSRNNLIDYRWFQQTFPFIGREYEDHVYDYSTSTYTSETLWNWNACTLSSATNVACTVTTTYSEAHLFPYASPITDYRYEWGTYENGQKITTTATNYSFDNYGNALTVEKTVTDNDPESPYVNDIWTTNVTNTPDVDTTHWCLGLNTETQVAYTATTGGSVTRTQTFTPDTTHCNYGTIITEPSSTLYKVTEVLGYDSFGNVSSDAVTGIKMPSSPATRTTTSNWGTTGQYLNSRKDPSLAETQWSYTSSQALSFGVPDSMTDPNSTTTNPIVTSWMYDAFGRKTQETRPDGTYTTWMYNACSGYVGCVFGPAVNILHDDYSNTGTLQGYGISFGDSIDRQLVAIQKMIGGNYSRNELRYDSLGRVSQVAMPCVYTTLATTCMSWTTNTYDFLNRLTQIQRPISSGNPTLQTATFAYDGRSTFAYDWYNTKTTTVKDVNGLLRQAIDAYTYKVTRAYDAAGTLTGITDSAGNTLLSGVAVAYGIQPFITQSTDADRGAWSFMVDSLGEPYQWTDANSKTFYMTYDALSRPLTRTEPDLYTVWMYGTATPNLGRLTEECTASAATTNLCNTTGASWLYNESRIYDTLARPSQRWFSENGNTGGNDGGGWFEYTLTYNSAGLPDTLKYPTSTSGSRLTLQYGYSYGLLQSITDTSDTTATCGTTCVLWTANTTDPFGHVTQETLGNNVQVNRTYDAVTSWLTQATAGVGGGASLLNLSYLQYENGNIKQRQNGSLTESFAYDLDLRLNCVALAATCTGTTITYDYGSAGPGNITNQTGVGSYTYPTAGQPRPHAVTSLTGTFNGIVNPSFAYDANGNMIKRASSSQNVYWYTSNYPSEITGSDATGTETVTFEYGPDRQRYEQVYTGPSSTETTYYVGRGIGPEPGQMEVVFNGTTNYRHYIYAGSEPIAIDNRSSAGDTMSYLLTDHQGSVAGITSSTGTTEIGTGDSFSAFGQLRNSQTWSGPPTPITNPQELAGLSTYTRQGYTFQTWLGQSMGLNHMNGRVEDAILGRMLSPDPHITDPANAQSYNRFSYVNNNPLTQTDPTGFDVRFCLTNANCGGVSILDTFAWPQPGEGIACNSGGCVHTYYGSVLSTAPGNNDDSDQSAQSQNTSPDPGAVQSTLGLESAPLAGGAVLGDFIAAIAEALGLAGSLSAPPPPAATLQLAQQIQGNVPLSAQTVVVLETTGPTIVTANGNGLSAAQIALAEEMGLTPGIPLGDKTHAEESALFTAGELGVTPTNGVSTNNVCTACASFMSETASSAGYTLVLSSGGKYFSFIPVSTFLSPFLFGPP